MLRGARLVTATETEEGRRWAESRIKQLTGGDTVSARFMRQDFFEYRPTVQARHRRQSQAAIRSVDEAIRRRFHLVPFAVTIPPEERDGELAEKLKAEWPGILEWMIEGALEWQADGLQPPQAVREATEAYLAAEDAIAAWIDDSANVHRPRGSRSADCSHPGQHGQSERENMPEPMKRFAQTLETRGFLRHKMTQGRGFRS